MAENMDPVVEKPTTYSPLKDRDNAGVEFSKGLLTEGDTLVIINYTGSHELYNASGFRLQIEKHLVNSIKLLETGSKMFERMFLPIQQARFLRRDIVKKHLIDGKLPEGIKFVLDLTPEMEGDDAASLTAGLSCSAGLCNWYKSEKLLKISSRLVGGKDNMTLNEVMKLTEDKKANIEKIEKSSTPQKNTEVPLQAQLIEDDKYFSRIHEQFANPSFSNTAASYSEIRHRCGIIALLQTIEGKDPKLDSAPKVWTLFALAKYFECIQVVRDHVISWIMAPGNSWIIEVLPEKSFEMGLVLESTAISRAAFMILVSEQAMALGPIQDHKSTALGRVKEDLDEELRQMVQYASQSFREAVVWKKNELLDLRWFGSLAEYQKLLVFQEDFINHNSPSEWKRLLFALYDKLHLYFRGRVIMAAHAPINDASANTSQRQRHFEHLLGPWKRKFSEVYDGLSQDERPFVIQFWQNMQRISRDFDLRQSSSAYLIDGLQLETDIVTLDELFSAATEFNKIAEGTYFDVVEFVDQAEKWLLKTTDLMLYREDDYLNGKGHYFEITEQVVILTESCWKYLPVWAGGENDGSYRVFNEEVPDTEVKFAPSGPGPLYHGADSVALSQWSVVEAGSIDTSIAVENGHDERQGAVMSDDDSDDDSDASLSFSDEEALIERFLDLGLGDRD